MRSKARTGGRGLIPTWASFRQGERGTTAVEFALIAGPFIAALLATMEIAMVMWTSEALETAVAKASRKVYTGEFQSDTSNASLSNAQLQAKLQAAICNEASVLITCSAIAVDVRTFSSFGSAAAPSPVSAQNTYNTSSYGYQSIGSSQIGIVTASMEYKTFFPALSGQTLANGNRAIVATAAFRTEPYSN